MVSYFPFRYSETDFRIDCNHILNIREFKIFANLFLFLLLENTLCFDKLIFF